jgi:hypothetical protein
MLMNNWDDLAALDQSISYDWDRNDVPKLSPSHGKSTS